MTEPLTDCTDITAALAQVGEYLRFYGAMEKHPREAVIATVVDQDRGVKARTALSTLSSILEGLKEREEDRHSIPGGVSPELGAAALAVQEWTGGEYGLKTATLAIEAYEAARQPAEAPEQAVEKPTHVITSKGCSICGTDALNCKFWKTYRKPEREAGNPAEGKRS